MKYLFIVSLVCVAGVGEPLWAGEEIQYNRKSPGGALVLSLAGTLVPGVASIPVFAASDSPHHWTRAAAFALVANGLILGPSVGHLYAR